MTKIFSLTNRLVIWFSLAFAVSSTVLFGTFYYLTVQTLLDQTDREILDHARALAYSENTLRASFESIPGMIIAITDASGQIRVSSSLSSEDLNTLSDVVKTQKSIKDPFFSSKQLSNSNFRLGVIPLTGENTQSLIIVGHPTDVIDHAMSRLLATLFVVTGLVWIPAAAGGWIAAKIALKPVKSIAEKMKKIDSGNLKDRLEIKETGDEIEELSHSFNYLLSRLEESFDRERQFIADIAHELKTPLTIIRSSMEVVLGKNRSNNDYRKTMEETVKVVDRLSGVVNDVLELARSKTEQDSNLFKTADLTSVVRDISELTEKLAVSKRISVSQKITSGVTIPGERQKLFRALFNLADNAVKYTPASGKIGIRLEKEKDHALFEISNTGKGIQPAELPNIFNRFYQGTGDRDTQGSGLGLAICKSIIEAHKGKISVFSQPGKTTVFKIHLPLTKHS